MKLLGAAIFVAILVGCSTTASDQNLSDEEKGKAALLALMRSKDSPFEGADPMVFEKIEIKFRDGEYYWGAFVIRTDNKSYHAYPELPAHTYFYDGRFTVDPSGNWTAEQPKIRRSLGELIPIGNRPDN